jgi:transposase
LNGEKQILEEFIVYVMLLINYKVNGRASAARSASQKDVRHRKKYRLKRAARRIRKKIRNLIDEIHKKFTKFLVDQYHTILLPKFETQKMIFRGNRRIGSKTARAMLTWSHFRFRQRLINKKREYPWCNVVVCDEHFTARSAARLRASKTCGNCGFIQRASAARSASKSREIETFYMPLLSNRNG